MFLTELAHFMSYPTVSIIIPAYNAEKYLQETLESILTQDYPSIEVIVVDDGSTDNTSDIVKSYSYDSRVQYIYKSNSGTAKSRNAGIQSARGDFLMFVDSDDLLSKNALSSLVKISANFSDTDYLIYGEMEFFEDKTYRKLNITKFSKTIKNQKNLYTLRTNLLLCCLIPRDVIDRVKGFNEKLKYNEDYEMLLRISKLTKIYGLDKVVYKYRVRIGSKTQTKSLEKAIEVTKKRKWYFANLLKDESLITKVQAWGSHYLTAGVEFREFDRQLSRLYLLISFLIYPLNLIPLRLLVASLRNRY